MLNSYSHKEDSEFESYNINLNRFWDDKDFDSISNFSESTVANSDYVEARIKYHESQRHQQHHEVQLYNHIDDANKCQIIKIKLDALLIDRDKNKNEGKGCVLKTTLGGLIKLQLFFYYLDQIVEKSTPQTVPRNKNPLIKCCQQIKLFYLIFVLIIIVMSIAIIMTHITVNENSTSSFENNYINLLNKYTTEKPSYHFNNKQTQSINEQLVVQKSAILRLKNETNTGDYIDDFRNVFFRKIGETIGCDPNKPNLTKHFYISRSVAVRLNTIPKIQL